MVCLRCRELASEYHRVLRTYLDLVESRKVVQRRGRAFVLVQERVAEIEKQLGEEWLGYRNIAVGITIAGDPPVRVGSGRSFTRNISKYSSVEQPGR